MKIQSENQLLTGEQALDYRGCMDISAGRPFRLVALPHMSAFMARGGISPGVI